MAEPAAAAQDVPEGFCLVRDHGDLHAKSVFMALVNCPLGVEALLLVLECDFETVSRREQEPSKDRRHAGRPAHDTQAQGGRPLQFVPCEGAHCRQCQSATRRSDGLAQGRLGRSARVKNTKKLFLCPDCFLLQIVCPTLSLVPHMWRMSRLRSQNRSRVLCLSRIILPQSTHKGVEQPHSGGNGAVAPPS